MTKRLSRTLGAAFSVFVALVGVGIWNAAFRAPPADRLPLPSGLIAADSSTGKELSGDKAYVADYASLTGNFEAQARAGFCGVASSVVVLNALHRSQPRMTQSTFFTDAASNVRGSLQVNDLLRVGYGA